MTYVKYPPPGWLCPECRDKKCRAHDRTERTLGDLGYWTTCYGVTRATHKWQIKELIACKKRIQRRLEKLRKHPGDGRALHGLRRGRHLRRC